MYSLKPLVKTAEHSLGQAPGLPDGSCITLCHGKGAHPDIDRLQFEHLPNVGHKI